MNFDDLKIYLPKYLSSESEKQLFSSLKGFPNNIDERLYSDYLRDTKIIYQGDGLKDLLAVNLKTLDKKNVNGMIFSNTCDLATENVRNFPSQIVYAPIISLDKYKSALKGKIDSVRLQSHIEAIKKQLITQIFYLPEKGQSLKESIVFLDRIFNVDNDFVKRDSLKDNRIFTLSDYGNYLFLFKLSLHFTRIQDKVERKSNSF